MLQTIAKPWGAKKRCLTKDYLNELKPNYQIQAQDIFKRRQNRSCRIIILHQLFLNDDPNIKSHERTSR